MGDAAYIYTKTADGCSISIDSRRAIQTGAEVLINECDVRIKTGALDGSVQRDLALFGLINSFLNANKTEVSNEPDTRSGD